MIIVVRGRKWRYLCSAKCRRTTGSHACTLVLKLVEFESFLGLGRFGRFGHFGELFGNKLLGLHFLSVFLIFPHFIQLSDFTKILFS